MKNGEAEQKTASHFSKTRRCLLLVARKVDAKDNDVVARSGSASRLMHSESFCYEHRFANAESNISRKRPRFSLCFILIASGCSGTNSEEIISQKLFTNHPGVLRDNFTGSVGCAFAIAEDRDVTVTHVGYYDDKEDGLQVNHRVGLFEVDGDEVDDTPLREAIVPWGRKAILQDGYRWVALKNRVVLQKGRHYVLVAEVESGVRDPWQERTCPPTIMLSGETEKPAAIPKWNAHFVGTQPGSTRLARW
jgi:hypothetical protein